MPGFSNQAYGQSPYGIGQPADDDPNGGGPLRDQFTGQTTGSRRIDPRSRDYVLSEFGRIRGMSDTQQLVLLAVSTERGSSAVRELGHQLRTIKLITANFERQVDSILRAALEHLVSRSMIEIKSILVERQPTPGRAYARVVWRDTATGRDDQTEVS